MTEQPKIITDTRHDIGIIIIHNPAKKNAVNNLLLQSMNQALLEMADKQLRAIIIRGSDGNTFCAGYDINHFPQGKFKAETYDLDNDFMTQTMATMTHLDIPLIAMVNGHCFGAGVDIASACDFRYGAKGFKFGVPAAKLGIIYSPEGIRRLINLIGLPKAKEIMLLGNFISTEKACELGFFNQLTDLNHLEDLCFKVADQLIRNAPLAVIGMKQIFRFLSEHEELAESRHQQTLQMREAAFQSKDAKEAIKKGVKSPVGP